MSRLVSDDALLDDMYAAIRAMRQWLMHLGEEHPDLSAAPLDDLLRRYREETSDAY